MKWIRRNEKNKKKNEANIMKQIASCQPFVFFGEKKL